MQSASALRTFGVLAWSTWLGIHKHIFVYIFARTSLSVVGRTRSDMSLALVNERVLGWIGLGWVWFGSTAATNTMTTTISSFAFVVGCALVKFALQTPLGLSRGWRWKWGKIGKSESDCLCFRPIPLLQVGPLFPLSWPLMRFDLGLANIPGTKYLSRLRPAFNWPDQVWPSLRLQPTCWKVPKCPQRKMYFWFIKLHECQHHQRDRLKNKRPTKCYLHLAKLP